MNPSLVVSTTLHTTAVLVAAALAGAASAQIALAPPVTVPTGPLPSGMGIADLDGDGERDLAVSTDNPDKINIHFNTGGTIGGGPIVSLPNSSSPGEVKAAFTTPSFMMSASMVGVHDWFVTR